MKFDLQIPAGPNQRDFLDYFNAELRKRVGGAGGSTGEFADGRTESVLEESPTGEGPPPMVWKLIRSPDGSLESLDVEPAIELAPGTDWTSEVHDLVHRVQTGTLAARKQRFFRRKLFSYMGACVDGEYWLPGFRFAPALPDDASPYLINAERIVVLDMHVHAIDDIHATCLAEEQARRHAARLSMLLNTAILPLQSEERWIYPLEGPADRESTRQHLGFFVKSVFQTMTMPEKGKLCRPGKYKGHLGLFGGYAGELKSLPPEARRILRLLDSAPDSIGQAFDRCARLCNVGRVAGKYYPSAGLAYRIAAVDAVSGAGGRREDLLAFFAKYTKPSTDRDALVEHMWGQVRSAHFHGGAFPSGEYLRVRGFELLMDSTASVQERLHYRCYALATEAIIRWLYAQLEDLSQKVDGVDHET